ncbi:MAG: triose-phosphate isomerase [bacterium]
MAVKKTKFVVGNWKMSPVSPLEAKKIAISIKKCASVLSKVTTVFAPPSIYLPLISRLCAKGEVKLSSQNVSIFKDGAHTGEVNAEMLKNSGVSFCIVGHSERRALGETDAQVSEKVNLLLENGIRPVICVGEGEHDHQGVYLEFLQNEIKNSLKGVTKKNASEIIIAYEPIWAVGAKEPMQNSDIHETTLFIKKVLTDIFGQEMAFSIPILYGGSVNMRNAKDIVMMGQVDGLLVGRESLNPIGFNSMLKEINSI